MTDDLSVFDSLDVALYPPVFSEFTRVVHFAGKRRGNHFQKQSNRFNSRFFIQIESDVYDAL